MSVFAYVWIEHFGLACRASLLFFGGVLAAVVVVRAGPSVLTRFPLALFRWVRRMIGPDPGLFRLGGVIFGFNATAMGLYMATGVRPLFPQAVALLTGFDITVILFMAGGEPLPGESPAEAGRGDRWRPGKGLTLLCGLVVLAVELPCFWYAVALGIGLGLEVASGRVGYLEGLPIRAHAYLRAIVPLLLLSAACEAVAIRGMEAALPATPRDA